MIYLTGVAGKASHGTELGLMCQPGNGLWRQIPEYPCWAADNGCFAGDWEEKKWLHWIRDLGYPEPPPLFATVPDSVSNWIETNYRWHEYRYCIPEQWPAAYVAQDSVTPERIPWNELDCLFVGGSTDWKLSDHAYRLMRLAKERGKWTHMGRVNSWRRFSMAAADGYDSVDGNVLAFDPPRIRSILNWVASSPLPL